MNRLVNQNCEACNIDAPKVTEKESQTLLDELDDWQLIVVDGINQITKDYTFKNFEQALAFTNKVGQLAESEGHHPAILTQWGEVRVTWWTHKIHGLHRNDFICAAKTDQLLV